MAARIAARYVSRRLSSGGKILSEEEKAAENIYIKLIQEQCMNNSSQRLVLFAFKLQKVEQEKLDKLARKGPKPEENPAPSSAGPAADAKPSGTSSSTAGVSTDKNRNYGVLAGVITGVAALGWYLKSSAKKPEVQED
ncbi:hypothetical protein Sjap_001138 [Stephania japonica]|uniref:Uncharacterized protein n=1 Tax=Stephania japonica TaxID=461633 RepID=A0AAP0KJE6_9MAGN